VWVTFSAFSPGHRSVFEPTDRIALLFTYSFGFVFVTLGFTPLTFFVRGTCVISHLRRASPSFFFFFDMCDSLVPVYFFHTFSFSDALPILFSCILPLYPCSSFFPLHNPLFTFTLLQLYGFSVPLGWLTP